MRSFLSALIYYAVETYDDWICHFQWDFDDLYMKNSFWSGCGQTICKVWCDDFLNNLYLAELEKNYLQILCCGFDHFKMFSSLINSQHRYLTNKIKANTWKDMLKFSRDVTVKSELNK